MSDLPPFRTVLRGHDPAQVDAVVGDLTVSLDAARREAAQRTVEVQKLVTANDDAARRLDAATARIAALEEEKSKAASPTFHDLGARIGSILSLADEEANEVREAARTDADDYRAQAAAEADKARAEADRYAEDVRTAAEAKAAHLVDDARSNADSILDDADRGASARREEAEAIYENQRAKAAAAAADFETTLAERRDRAAADFAAQVGAHEDNLRGIQARADQLAGDSTAAHQEARTSATAMTAQAQEEAALLVQHAREQADRISRDSDRRLAAATARRDSINAQLSNVRQMLATLGAPATPGVADAGGAADASDSFETVQTTEQVERSHHAEPASSDGSDESHPNPEWAEHTADASPDESGSAVAGRSEQAVDESNEIDVDRHVGAGSGRQS